mmetsp:Transcript_39963/g.95888  ORF Transcript_39963/g.95888 Transcript_39963/m.95888 type:complete len:232 (-) Transcript_39963:267-962(-)
MDPDDGRATMAWREFRGTEIHLCSSIRLGQRPSQKAPQPRCARRPCLAATVSRSAWTILFTKTAEKLRMAFRARSPATRLRIHSMTSDCTCVLRWDSNISAALRSSANSWIKSSNSSTVGGTRVLLLSWSSLDSSLEVLRSPPHSSAFASTRCATGPSLLAAYPCANAGGSACCTDPVIAINSASAALPAAAIAANSAMCKACCVGMTPSANPSVQGAQGAHIGTQHAGAT